MGSDWFLAAKQKYIASLDEKAARLEELLSVYRSDPSNTSAREDLRAAFHRIHGSAGSYGLGELGEICGWCEEHLIRLRSEDRAGQADLDALVKAIEEFKALSAEERQGD